LPRRHRHFLNRIIRAMLVNPERLYDESFSAPSLGGYDIA
jgi:hypothetical protein